MYCCWVWPLAEIGDLVSLTSQLRDGELNAWCTSWFPGSVDVARSLAAATKGRPVIRPIGEVRGRHWAAVSSTFGIRLAALIQPAPPYYALHGLVKTDLVTPSWAHEQAALYPTHARLPAAAQRKALDLRPTAVGWLDVASGRDYEPGNEAHHSDEAARQSSSASGKNHRHPAQSVLTDFFDRTRTYLTRHAPPGQPGTSGVEAGMARICWLLEIFESVYRSGQVNDVIYQLFRLSVPTVEKLRAVASEPVVAELVALSEELERSGALREFRRLAGDPAAGQPLGIAGPVFVNHWADGDLILNGPEGGTLIAVKAVASANRTGSMVQWLWQLIGYAWLDVGDRYRIRKVGLYFARHGVLVTWSLESLLDMLLGGRDRAEALHGFRYVAKQVLACEGARLPDGDVDPLREEAGKRGVNSRSTASPNVLAPRQDGLYASRFDDKTYFYLRFCESRKVVEACSTGKPEQVAKWLTLEDSTHCQGTYRMSGQYISFTTKGPEGEFGYDGYVSKGSSEIRLTKHNKANSKKKRLVFQFISVQLPAVSPNAHRFDAREEYRDRRSASCVDSSFPGVTFEPNGTVVGNAKDLARWILEN